MTDEQKMDDALLAYHDADLDLLAAGVSERIKLLAGRVEAGEVDCEKAIRGAFAVAYRIGGLQAVETMQSYSQVSRTGERVN